MHSNFQGQNEKLLEVQDSDSPLVVDWGHFEAKTKTELEFDHACSNNVTGKVIETRSKRWAIC